MPSRLLRPLLATTFLALAVPAARADELHVAPAALPAPFLDRGRVDTTIEASGVEPIGDGKLLLVAHDKAPALHIVDATSGEFVGGPITSPRFPTGGGPGPKWEGMARDADGNFYVIGAHNGATEPEREAKSRLIRFRLREGATPSIDDASVVRWQIAGPLAAALKAEGLDPARVNTRKIEGLAIRERAGAGGKVRRELVVGLREPDDLVRAFAADVTNAPAEGGSLELARLFAFTPSTREGVRSQLTSMEYVPAWKGFVVVTATEDKQNAFHGNTLWFLADDRIPSDGLAEPRPFHVFETAMKAEGLCVLPGANPAAARLLVTFDNDPHATHIPSRFQVLNVTRTP